MSSGAGERLRAGLRDHGFRSVLLYGPGMTGRAVQSVLGDAFAGFVDHDHVDRLRTEKADALLLTVGPTRYAEVFDLLRRRCPGLKVPVVTIFQGGRDLDVRLILETLPRSGTSYVLNNLMKCLPWGLAAPFPEGKIPAGDGILYYIPREGADAYVAFSHHYRPLHYPEYRYIPTVFQFSYIFDAFHSWGKYWLEGVGRPIPSDYRLTAGSDEWEMIRREIPLLVSWFEFVADKTTVRYEDYYLDFERTVGRLAGIAGVPRLEGFEPPRKNPERMYWSDRYAECFDREVFAILRDRLGPALDRWWPEKRGRIDYR